MVIRRISSFGFHGDYLSDRIVRVFSVLLYIVIAINMWVELKRDDVTVCWSPAKFTPYQAAYVNKLCQTDGTVFPRNVASIEATESTVKSAKETSQFNIRKLRCLPIVVASQALLFLLPWLLWRSVSDNMCSLDAFIRESQNSHQTSEHRQACIAYLSSKLLVYPVCKLGRGYLLYLVYIFKRFLYILVCLLQMGIFSGFLEVNFFMYGRRRSMWDPHGSIKTLVDYPHGVKGEARLFNISVRTYPSEVNCEFQLPTDEGMEDQTVQCTVPPVDTVETNLSVIWIWLLFLICLALYSLVQHLVKYIMWSCSCLQTYKVRYVSCYLSHRPNYKSASQAVVKKFVSSYMKPDIYFVSNMVELNGSLRAAMAMFEGLWENFLGASKISTDERQNSVEELSSLAPKNSEI